MKPSANTRSMPPAVQPCRSSSFLASLKEEQAFCLLASVYIIDEALEERQSSLLHASFSVLNGRMGKIWTGYSPSGSGLASGNRKLVGAGGWNVASVSRT